MKQLRKFFEIPSVLFENSSSILLAIVCGISLLNVLARTLFHSPIYGSIEVVQYGVLLAMCLALPASTLYGSHARVTIITDAIPFFAKKIFLIITNLASIVLFAIITVYMYTPMVELIRRGRTTDVLKVPYYLIHVAIMLGILLMMLVLVFQLIESFAMKKESLQDSQDDKCNNENQQEG